MKVAAKCLLLAVLACPTTQAGMLRDGDRARDLVAVPEPDTALLNRRLQQTIANAEAEFDQANASSDGEALGIAYGRIGMRYQAHELNLAAEPAYRNAATLDPTSFKWHYYLGFLYHETGDYESAIEAYDRARLLAPDRWQIRLREGLAALGANRPRAARAAFREVLARRPDEAAALEGLGRVAMEQRAHAEAVALFERALELQPAADRLHYRLGLAYRSLGRMADARIQLEQSGTIEPGFDDETLSLMQVRTRPPEFFMTQGMAAAETGDVEQALFMFELAVEIAPRYIPSRVSLGRTQMVTGRVDAAVLQLARAVDLDPGNVLAISSLGQAYEMGGDDAAALGLYQRWLELVPTDPQAHLLSGNAYMRQARYLDAEASYRFLTRNGDGAAAWLKVGMSQLARGACDEALDSLQRSAEQLGQDPTLRMARARAWSTCSRSTPAEREAALEDAQALYQRWPAEETAATLAMALAANDRAGEAGDLVRQILLRALRTGRAAIENELLNECLELFGRGLPASRAFAPSSPLINPARLRP